MESTAYQAQPVDDPEIAQLEAAIEAGHGDLSEIADVPKPSKEPDPAAQEETKTEEPPAEAPKDEAEIQDKPEDSKFVRKRKELQRLEKTWDAANKRKAELDAQEARLRQAAQQLQRPPQKPAFQDEEEVDLSPPKPKFKGSTLVFNGNEYTADDLAKIAKQQLMEGNEAAGTQCLDLARKLEARNAHYGQIQRQQAETVQFNEEAAAAVKDRPELLDMSQPVTQNVRDIYQATRGALTRVPGGFGMMVRVAELGLKAAQVDAVTKERDALQARVKELEGKTSLGGSPPATKASGKRSAEDLDDADLESRVEAELNARFANRY